MRDDTKKRKSKYRGVCRVKDSELNPWFASCQNKYLGAFSTEEDAARVYDAKALELLGPNAITNASLGLLPPARDGYKPQKVQKQRQNPFIGITRCKRNLLNPWMANISHKGKVTNIGSFPTAEDAARAYDEYALKLRGNDARTNVTLGLLPPARPGESVLAKASRINKTTKYTGVSFIRAAKIPFRAYIEHNKEKIIIGYYSNPEDAAKAYDRMAVKLRGQNAKTNASRGLLLKSQIATNHNEKIVRYSNKHTKKTGKYPSTGGSINARITSQKNLAFQQKRQKDTVKPIVTSRKSKRLRTIPSKKGQPNGAYSCRSSPPSSYRT
mmetsp:Transcript_21176/g.29690  ORF Transcript_21176/g.29690 Transcript_21176/m.29690 type:complete len:326 (+) Transcript_21176:80-1057(+)